MNILPNGIPLGERQTDFDLSILVALKEGKISRSESVLLHMWEDGEL